jgi:hypothetical protein
VDIGDYTDGYDFERGVLGISSIETNNQVKDYFTKDMKFGKAVRVVKDIQNKLGNWNPKVPSTRISKILFDGITNKISHKFSHGKLRLYSSVGTLLDYKYGVDFFFLFKGKGYKEVIVTIDLTISPKKKKKRNRADVVLSLGDFKSDNYKYIIDKIVVILINKTKRQDFLH